MFCVVCYVINKYLSKLDQVIILLYVVILCILWKSEENREEDTYLCGVFGIYYKYDVLILVCTVYLCYSITFCFLYRVETILRMILLKEIIKTSFLQKILYEKKYGALVLKQSW